MNVPEIWYFKRTSPRKSRKYVFSAHALAPNSKIRVDSRICYCIQWPTLRLHSNIISLSVASAQKFWPIHFRHDIQIT